MMIYITIMFMYACIRVVIKMSDFCVFSGFIRGQPGEIPNLLTFQPKFEEGALLTIVSVTVLL